MRQPLLAFAAIAALLFLAASFEQAPRQSRATALVRQMYQDDLKALRQDMADYARLAGDFAEGRATLAELQARHSACRLAFKRCEMLLDYTGRHDVKRYINGAPLPKLEPNVPEISIIDPKGLQRLDELLFGDAPESEAAHIADLAAQLASDFAKSAEVQRLYPLSDREVLEAARLALWRLFALGLTGFDTPGSGAALPEALATWDGIERYLQAYVDLMAKAEPGYAPRFAALFAEGRRQLAAGDFDSFDRLHFLRSAINPLAALILDLHVRSGIEMRHEVSDELFTTRDGIALLFDAELLDERFFSKIKDPSAAQAELGRLLFFDPILSRNNARSCASCHRPELAFTDGQPRSFAFDMAGRIERNAPTLINAVLAHRYFLDMRTEDFEKQIEHVVFSPEEFDMDFAQIAAKLEQSAEYQARFKAAYPALRGRKAITGWTVQNAIAVYMQSLIAFDSPFDRYARGESDSLDAAAQRGFNLFMGKANCGTCHFAPTFAGLVPPFFDDSESEVLGVPANTDWDKPVLDGDLGRYANRRPKEKAEFYQRSFKTVTVRNAAHTAPYMHNGIYGTLDEVLRFYNLGGGAGMGLDVPHQTLPPDPLGLSDAELADLKAFMLSLSDTTGLTAYPSALPAFEAQPEWNARPIGGHY